MAFFLSLSSMNAVPFSLLPNRLVESATYLYLPWSFVLYMRSPMNKFDIRTRHF